MRRALRLASLSLGMTWPNPGVGCVLVREGRLLGEGRHRVCGGPHAEVAALADCRARGLDPAGATAFVTLAPCTRQGRQPPCVQALVAARLARVVAAIADPGQEDAGPPLRSAGIAYELGCGAEAAAGLHGGFLSRILRGRPRITGKWAMSADGCIASAPGVRTAISPPGLLAWSRRRRRAYDAILVGAGTAEADDPELLARPPRRHGDRASPLRVLVSAGARLAHGSRLLATLDRAPLLLVHGPQAPADRLAGLRALGVVLLPCAEPHRPETVARLLGDHGLNELLVEGGATLHAAWLRAGLYDRLELGLAPLTLAGGLPVASSGPASPCAWIEEAPPRTLDGGLFLRLRRA